MTYQLLLSEAEVVTRYTNRRIKGPAFKSAILNSFGDFSVRISAKRIDVFTQRSGEHGGLLRDDAKLVAQSI
jgi:hypothetical protein